MRPPWALTFAVAYNFGAIMSTERMVAAMKPQAEEVLQVILDSLLSARRWGA
jgi:hypothetical protein